MFGPRRHSPRLASENAGERERVRGSERDQNWNINYVEGKAKETLTQFLDFLLEKKRAGHRQAYDKRGLILYWKEKGQSLI